MTTESTFDLRRLAPALGAEARCGDVKQLAERDFAAIRAALNYHLVLLFREQHLTDEDLIAFGRHLGDIDVAPLAYTDDQQQRKHPEVLIISNVKENGVPIGVLGDAEVVWHSDNSYRETPLAHSLLYARELPPAGGETEFANMYLAWETLPRELQERVRTLTIKHDLTYNSAPVTARLPARHRSRHRAGATASDRAHASGNRPSRALSRAAAERLHPGTAGRGIRKADQHAVDARDATRIRVVAHLARR